MIVISLLALLLALVAFPFIAALAFHAARVIVDGVPCRVAVVRLILRKAIGRNFRAPKGPGLQASKGPLARALRFPQTGIGALVRALVSYKVAQVRCAAVRALVAVKVAVAAETIPLASRLQRALRPVPAPMRPAATLTRAHNATTGVCEVWQGARLLGSAVPGPQGPVWIPVPAHRAGKREVEPC